MPAAHTAAAAAAASPATSHARSHIPLPPHFNRRALTGRDSGGASTGGGGGASSSSRGDGVALPLMQLFGVSLMSFGSLAILGYVAWKAVEWYQRHEAGYVEMATYS